MYNESIQEIIKDVHRCYLEILNSSKQMLIIILGVRRETSRDGTDGVLGILFGRGVVFWWFVESEIPGKLSIKYEIISSSF